MNNNVDFANDAALLGLNRSGPQRLGRIAYWWSCHLRAFLFACGELIRSPISNLMTLFVIGIAFSLPVTLFALLQNVESVITNWQTSPRIELYLKQNTSQAQINTILQNLNQNTKVEKATYISPQQGLQSLQRNGSVTQDSIQSLGSNPLPAVIQVTPNHINSTPQSIQQLYAQLQQINSVDMAQLNLNWVKHLYYLVETIKYLTLAIAILFSVGLILIVGNTVRLDMKSNQEEIDILRLIGANKAFIRRPLLYRGLLYGCIGGFIAWMLCGIFLWWMQVPASHLAMSYNSTITLHGLRGAQGILVIIIGGALSYIGARFVINYYLRKEHILK
jgi:cell division transport system permease protein